MIQEVASQLTIPTPRREQLSDIDFPPRPLLLLFSSLLHPILSILISLLVLAHLTFPPAPESGLGPFHVSSDFLQSFLLTYLLPYLPIAKLKVLAPSL